MRSMGSGHKGSHKDSINDRSDGKNSFINEEEELADEVPSLMTNLKGSRPGLPQAQSS